MNTTENPNQEPSKRASTPWWMWLVAAPIVHGIVPWAILIWGLVLHFAQSPEGVEMVLAKSYLLRHGPYAFSRHPMYLSELALLFGWVIFYGSVAVLIGFLVACAVFNFVNVPLEERALEARLGETYRQYKNTVPRWFGKIRR